MTGAQGFFDTSLAIANTNDEPTTATLTFLREDDAPVVKTVEIGPFARTKVYAGDSQDSAAHVELRYLLDTGEAITRPRRSRPGSA